MANEANDVNAKVKYAKIIKWENDENGMPMKHKEPLEIMEKFGDDEPFKTTFKRSDQ